MTATSILSIVNPASGAQVAEVPADNAASVAAKAAQARAAQSAWAATPLAERLAVVRRFRSAVVDQKESLAATLTQEVGKPIAQSRNELAGLLPRLDFFLESAAGAFAEEEVYAEASLRERISREPLGVVGNISAWNYPWFVGCNVIVPALLAGNAVLYKPSEYATLTGLALARLLRESGLPPALLPCVVGGGETGAAVIAQRIDGLFFTGSHATGVRIAQALAGRLVRLQLELGGKDPVYVRADADVAAAAESLADGAMYNTGQSCCSVERIYVHERLHDAFVERFVATVRAMKRGDPTQPDTYVGAITRAPQLQVLQSQVDEAVALGAVLHCGGRVLPGPGNWFDPAVLSQVDHRMALMREESFGPVIGIQRVSGDDEAVKLMNDTRYGLTAGVYTRDEAAARSVLARVNAGSVYWNCCDRVSPRLPWSGVGDSGIGLTLSVEGLRAFTRPKAWHLRSPAANQ